jgi:hypothetical protein
MRYNKSRTGKNKTRTRSTRTNARRSKTNKIKTNKIKTNKKNKMKGGFSAYSVWDTMTYNLSNALSTFSISPPTAIGNVSEPVNPSVSKQFLQAEN